MPTRDQLQELIGNTPLFASAAPDTVSAIAEAMHPVRFDAGRTIFNRGEPGTELYFVQNGTIKVSVLTAEGRELAFSHIGPGSFLGEIALFDGGARTADAMAMTATDAWVLTAAAAQRLLNDHTDFSHAVIRFLCGRLRAADLQLEGVALHRIETRLARYLLALCRQVAPEVDEGRVDVKLGMAQGELAVLLGASRPKLNQALMSLEASGAVSREGQTLNCEVADLAEIAEMAE